MLDQFTFWTYGFDPSFANQQSRSQNWDLIFITNRWRMMRRNFSGRCHRSGMIWSGNQRMLMLVSSMLRRSLQRFVVKSNVIYTLYMHINIILHVYTETDFDPDLSSGSIVKVLMDLTCSPAISVLWDLGFYEAKKNIYGCPKHAKHLKNVKHTYHYLSIGRSKTCDKQRHNHGLCLI